jgi:LytS/YehU family sensor histidine kinase
MEKNKLISFKDEIKLVTDYLNLEKIRYEERLNFTIQQNSESSQFQIPPLLLQTLVENAIKHGISKLPKGGSIDIYSSENQQILEITITNDGKYEENIESDSGFGLKNSIERLKFLFGNSASLSINNENNKVVTHVIIPKHSLN